MWRSCRLLASLMRSLCLLPGGLGRFVPCSIGANHCRLRHIGWEKCGHGLTSRPRESASVHFLDELLVLFRYPSGSGRALLAGTLLLRYCTTRFACMMPTWRLPALGAVRSLVAAYSEDEHKVVADEVDQGVSWISGLGPGRKRIRLIRKTPAHLVGYLTHSRPKVWKRLRHVGFIGFSILFTRGGGVSRVVMILFLLRKGLGLGNSLGMRSMPPGCMFLN